MSQADVALPDDLLRDVFLRLQAKDLCRLRAVCRSWSLLLSDPLFAAAHKSRHPGPLFVTCKKGDASGAVVKRLHAGIAKARLLRTRLEDLVCVTGRRRRGRAIDPATGHAVALPGHRASYGHRIRIPQVLSLGQVASTGEYKALRCVNNASTRCAVITLNDGCRNARWSPGPPMGAVRPRGACKHSVVVDGIVYFLLAFNCHEILSAWGSGVLLSNTMAMFDPETEAWLGILEAPTPLNSCRYDELCLANLNGFFVMVHRSQGRSLDLWFLLDAEKRFWEMYSVAYPRGGQLNEPLEILSDGRIAFTGSSGSLTIYDPATDDCTDFEMRGASTFVSIYTGNLLASQT